MLNWIVRLLATLVSLGTLAAGPNVRAGELEDRAEIERVARGHFQAGDLAAILDMGTRLRAPSERTSSGLAKLTLFYYGLQTYMTANTPMTRRTDASRQTQRLVREYPRSATAHLLGASYLLWTSVTSIASPNVDGGRRPGTGRRMEELLAYLDEIRWAGDVDPHWFDLRIRALKRLGRSDEEIHAAIDEGLATHPEYLQLYFVALDVFAPSWGGDAREIEFFTQYVVRKTRARLGEAMYARMYWYAFQVHYGVGLFLSSDVDWPRMKIGIEDVLSRYPDQWNIQTFAFFACLKEDQPFLEGLFERIEGEPISSAWGQQEAIYTHCQDLALGTPG